jgi:hypothetical protein
MDVIYLFIRKELRTFALPKYSVEYLGDIKQRNWKDMGESDHGQIYWLIWILVWYEQRKVQTYRLNWNLCCTHAGGLKVMMRN